MIQWLTTKAWPWVKKHWEVVLTALGAIAGFIFLGQKKMVVVAPELVGAGAKEHEINEAAAKKEEAAKVELDKHITAIEAAHSEVISALTDDQKKSVEQLRSNPEELNSFLLNVGKKMRE